MSFANQSLSAEYIASGARELTRTVHDVPARIDTQIAALIKLAAMEIEIDVLTGAQQAYLSGWRVGT